MAEHLIRNEKVVGSTPTISSKTLNFRVKPEVLCFSEISVISTY